MSTTTAPTTVSANASRLGRRSPWYSEIADLLEHEAMLLDSRQNEDWLDLLHPELEYRCGIRITTQLSDGDGDTGSAYHYDDTKGSLTMRVQRLSTGSAWAEDPPSRVRRFVTSIRVASDCEGDEIDVSSYLLVTRIRLDWSTPNLVTGERRDSWHRHDGRLLLRRRDVTLDQTTLATENLSFFL